MIDRRRFSLNSSQAGIMGRWQRAFMVGGFVSLLVVGYVTTFGSPSSFDTTSTDFSEIAADSLAQQPFDEVIRELYESEKVSLTETSFTDSDGDIYKLPADLIYTEPQGKRICILDVDTRTFNNDGELFSPHEWKWPKVEHLSAGMMGHYLYAQIHGYDYQMLRAPRYADRHDAWGKVLMMQHALKTHDIVLFMDSDAILPYPELPLEWLMNYWQINSTVAVAIASESELERDRDSRGNPGQNSGFMIIQNHAKTHELYKAWAECPDEKRYAGCAKWKQTKLREQSAFVEYIRYDPEFEPYIKILPCTESNGYPEQYKESKCKGVFVRHHWLNKGLTRDIFAENIMRMWSRKMHEWYISAGRQRGGFVSDFREKSLVGSKIVD